MPRNCKIFPVVAVVCTGEVEVSNSSGAVGPEKDRAKCVSGKCLLKERV